MHLEENEELTHWLGNLLLRHFGQEGDLHFRKTTGPPIFIKLNFGGSNRHIALARGRVSQPF